MKILKSLFAGIIKGIKTILGLSKDVVKDAKTGNIDIDKVGELITVTSSVAVGVVIAVKKLSNEFAGIKPQMAMAGGPAFNQTQHINPVTNKGYYVKILDPKKVNKPKGEAMWKEEGIELLDRITATRNAEFKSLTIEQKLKVLRAENFSVASFLLNEKYGNDYINHERDGKINFDSSTGTWEPNSESFLNNPVAFIKEWIFDQPLKVNKNKLFIFKPLAPGYTPNIYYNSPTHIDKIKLDIQRRAIVQVGDIDRYVKRYSYVSDSGMCEEEIRIRTSEALKGKSFEDYKKGVKKRMKKIANPNVSILDMMSGINGEKKKSKKSDKKDDLGFMYNGGSAKKKAKKAKRELEDLGIISSGDLFDFGNDDIFNDLNVDSLFGKNEADYKKKKKSKKEKDYDNRISDSVDAEFAQVFSAVNSGEIHSYANMNSSKNKGNKNKNKNRNRYR